MMDELAIQWIKSRMYNHTQSTYKYKPRINLQSQAYKKGQPNMWGSYMVGRPSCTKT